VVADSILVGIDRRPLDIVLDRAGYTDDLERVPWLGRRHVHFIWRDVS
jgi:hypothetical protein